MSSRLRLLVLSEPTYPRHAGGAGKCTHQMAAALAARGHAVTILCESDGEWIDEVVEGVQVHRVPFAMEDEAGRAEVLKNYVSERLPPRSFDLVHDSGSFLSYFFPLERWLRESAGLPLVAHFRYLILRHQVAAMPGLGWDAYDAGVLGIETTCRETSQCFAVRMADLVLAPSREEVEFIGRIYRPDPGRLDVLPDPVFLPENLAGLRRRMRERMARPEERLILFGGRIDSDLKGADVVLEGFERLTAAMPGVRLLVAARGGEQLDRFSERLGSGMTPLGWVDDSAELAAILAAVDLVWMPSRYESFGMMCAEAMAAGVPVIGAGLGGLKEMIAHGERGYLLDPAQAAEWPAQLAEYSQRVLTDRGLWAAMGRATRAYAAEHLSVEQTTARLEAMYDRVLAEREAAAAPAFPRVTEADREHYLDTLERRQGERLKPEAEAVWREWPHTAAARCQECGRNVIAENIQQLASDGATAGRIRRVFTRGGLRGQRAAVRDCCPLSLLQREWLNAEAERS